jgi:hypothetical protein
MKLVVKKGMSPSYTSTEEYCIAYSSTATATRTLDTAYWTLRTTIKEGSSTSHPHHKHHLLSNKQPSKQHSVTQFLHIMPTSLLPEGEESASTEFPPPSPLTYINMSRTQTLAPVSTSFLGTS